MEIKVNGKMVKRAELICENCGEVFHVKPSHGGKAKNCSKECCDEYKRKQEYERMCENVGGDFKEWLIAKYEIELLATREISEIVYGTRKNSPNILMWMKKLDIKIRDRSTAVANQFNKPGRREISSKIAKKHLNKEEVRMKAYKTQMLPENRLKNSLAKKGKNNPMYGVRGEDSPHWNPDYDSNLNIQYRKDADSVAWRKKVFDKDNYTCCVCHDNTGGNLNAHHLNGWNWAIDERFEVDNGVTLCTECHKAFHAKYGYGDNTKQQFNEFSKLRA